MTTQTEKVYLAEAGMRPHRVFTNLSEIQHYVNSIIESNWWKKKYRYVKRIDVRAGRKNGIWASAENHSKDHGYGIINLPPNGFDEITLIHEMAHTVTPPRVEHGPKFVENYVYLMDQVSGPSQAKELKAFLKQFGVRF